jgi:ABC-type glycerol-3-phosphate transport system substrate-binding protein
MVHAGIAVAAVGILLAGCASGGQEPDEKITLTFQSLAFQEATIDATQEIVDAWNEDNPNVQVELIQGSWDAVHDQLVTQFQGGTAPDIIHDESADIAAFGNQGYLADLSDYLSDDVTGSISDEIWGTVTNADGAIVAAPTLLQSYVVFANTDALADAGVEVPTGDSMTWDEFADIAAATTQDGKHGIAWGLKSPTATVMNLALGFGGGFFKTDGDTTSIDVGDAELEVPQRIHDLAFVDKVLDPVTLTQGGSEVLPGFYAGDYAMFVGGNYYAQTLVAEVPDGFNWTVLPPLEGSKGTSQAANPQTLSVSAQSKHVEQAAEFINFFMSNENLAKIAEGDWLIPTSQAARDQVLADTGGENGWEKALASGEQMEAAPFQSAANYPQWKDQIATPALQQYFADQISLDDLKKQLTDGWAQVNG